jgi:hypothetical protein
MLTCMFWRVLYGLCLHIGEGREIQYWMERGIKQYATASLQSKGYTKGEHSLSLPLVPFTPLQPLIPNFPLFPNLLIV